MRAPALVIVIDSVVDDNDEDDDDGVPEESETVLGMFSVSEFRARLTSGFASSIGRFAIAKAPVSRDASCNTNFNTSR